MNRDGLVDLHKWKESLYRKPLVMRGARQTGKTWLLREFGKTAFKNYVYVNFEETPNLRALFKDDFDIARIITTLQIYSQISIIPEETLIIFDEIQSAEKGITSLKYFYENAPQYFIVAAGSLLGMTLHSDTSFPVGKVNFIDLRPMSYAEFLSAVNENGLAEIIRKQEWNLFSVFHHKLTEYLRYYFYVGGMPEVVKIFAETRNWELVRQTQNQILHAYEGDFSKHAPKETVPRIRMVWQSIPSQLAKENKKFVFGIIRQGTRAKDFEMAIQWLVDGGLLIKCHRVTKPYLPLAAYQELSVFKLFLLDVGLLGAMAGLNVRTIIEGDTIYTEFKGAFSEQFVMQQLRLNNERFIGYWTNERSTAEVDFVIQEDGRIIPLEVKSGTNLHSKSFKLFCEKFKPEKAVRTTLTPYKKEEWMENIPLYGII
jgi:predicted AAA+ superfamily ATPase